MQRKFPVIYLLQLFYCRWSRALLDCGAHSCCQVFQVLMSPLPWEVSTTLWGVSSPPPPWGNLGESCNILVMVSHSHAIGLWFYPRFVKWAIVSPCFLQSIKAFSEHALGGQMKNHECDLTGKMLHMHHNKCILCSMHFCACYFHSDCMEILKLWHV